jgi:hypothetical protein
VLTVNINVIKAKAQGIKLKSEGFKLKAQNYPQITQIIADSNGKKCATFKAEGPRRRLNQKRNFWGRSRSQALLGFAFQHITGQMWVGLRATKPNNAWSWLSPTYEKQKGPG